MVDHLTKERRSWNMSRIRSKDTKPELIVRSVLHQMGYRFRLHGKVAKRYSKKGVLPGKPDIVLAKYRTVIFIHGCFWHRHRDCKYATIPTSNREYWIEKFKKNIERDREHQNNLYRTGWKSFVIWECETHSDIADDLAEMLILRMCKL